MDRRIGPKIFDTLKRRYAPVPETVLNRDQTSKVLNEWMRRYVDEPERFEAEVTTLKEFLAEEAAGKEPSYGECCGPYMFQIAEELGLIEVTK